MAHVLFACAKYAFNATTQASWRGGTAWCSLATIISYYAKHTRHTLSRTINRLDVCFALEDATYNVSLGNYLFKFWQ